MNKLNHYLYQITCLILVFFFALVFFMTLGNLSHMEPLSAHLTGILRLIFLSGGAVLLLGLIFMLTNRLKELSSRNRAFCLLILSGTGILLQLFLILKLRPTLQCDALKPVDLAVSLLNGGSLKQSVFYDYFTIYPHNLPLTLYILQLFKCFRFLGFPQKHFMILLQCFNLLLIDLSLVTAYFFLKKKSGIRVSSNFALLCVLNPLLYYYPVFFYTQVLSMPLFLFLTVLFFQLLDAKTPFGHLGYGALYGITLFFGWKIRFLTLIAPIAGILYLLFCKRETKPSWKAVLLIFLGMTVTFSCCTCVQKAQTEQYQLSTSEDLAFPVHHWLMMGLQGDGSYNYIDEAFTSALPSKEVRMTEATRVIKERLNDLRPGGLLRLWGRKLSVTWADGYDDYASNLLYVKHSSRINDWLTGKYAFVLAGYLHIYNCMSWFLLLFCAIQLLRRKLSGVSYCICLTILGGMIFHLFWEAGEAYSMPFALLMISGASIGFDCLWLPSVRAYLTKKNIKRIAALAAFCFSGVCIFSAAACTKEPYEVTKIRAKQSMLAGDYIYLENGQVLTQTITCERPFNQLSVQNKYYDTAGEDAVITLKLFDSSHNCILEEQLPLTEIITSSEFTFERVIPHGSEIYTVEISGTSIPDGCRGALTAYHTGNWDVYLEGTLSLDGTLLENTDLCFTLSDTTNET